MLMKHCSTFLSLTGATIKHRSLVSTFGMMLLAFLCISIGTGIYTIYSLFREQGQALIQACLSEASDFSPENCKASASLMQAVIVMIYTAMWLLQLCAWRAREKIVLLNSCLPGGFIIVRDYCHQLGDEEAEGLKPKIDPFLRNDDATIAFWRDRLPNRSEA